MNANSISYFSRQPKLSKSLYSHSDTAPIVGLEFPTGYRRHLISDLIIGATLTKIH